MRHTSDKHLHISCISHIRLRNRQRKRGLLQSTQEMCKCAPGANAVPPPGHVSTWHTHSQPYLTVNSSHHSHLWRPTLGSCHMLIALCLIQLARSMIVSICLYVHSLTFSFCFNVFYLSQWSSIETILDIISALRNGENYAGFLLYSALLHLTWSRFMSFTDKNKAGSTKHISREIPLYIFITITKIVVCIKFEINKTYVPKLPLSCSYEAINKNVNVK